MDGEERSAKTETQYDLLMDSRRKERRAAAVRAVRRVARKVEAAGGRVVVFGSLVEGGFDERSDIDLALMGLPNGVDEEFSTQIFLDMEDMGFACDAIPERFLSPSLLERVRSHGRESRSLG